MDRTAFLAAAGCAALVPFAAGAQEEQLEPPDHDGASPRPHVHGPNDVVTLPTNRPLDWRLQVLDGPDFQLRAYRGKVVFLNVFATWCPPCNSEQSDLVAFAAAHTDDTAVIGIDVAEEDNTVRAYRKKYGITYPIAMDRSDTSARTIFVKNLVFPTTIVLRPDGTLSCAWAAPHDKGWFEVERLAALA